MLPTDGYEFYYDAILAAVKVVLQAAIGKLIKQTGCNQKKNVQKYTFFCIKICCPNINALLILNTVNKNIFSDYFNVFTIK